MMTANNFATIEDLEKRFRALDSKEKDKADALLGDASVLISLELASAGIAIDNEDEVQVAALRVVCCAVVKRALSGGGESITQASMTAGPFTKQMTYANPTADLYLTKQDRRVLGIPQSGCGATFVRPMIQRGEHDA